MKRSLALLGAILAATLCVAQPPGLSLAVQHPETALPIGDETPLFSTLPNIAPVMANSVGSQFFLDQPQPAGGYFSIAMDDFIIPTGERWRIDRLEVRGNYQFAEGITARSVNVFFVRANAGGTQPATTDIFNANDPNVIFVGTSMGFNELGFGDFSVPLPAPITLQEGTYFVGIHAISLAQNIWLWTESSSEVDSGVPVGAPSVWMENLEIFGPPICVNNWGARIATCGATDVGDTTPPEPDMAFALYGEGGMIGLDIDAPPALATSESGNQDAIRMRLSGVPTAPVEVRFTSLTPNEALLSTAGGAPAATQTLTFSESNWDSYQTINVLGQDDNFVDPGGAFLIVTNVTSNDTAYAALEAVEFAGVNLDDRCDVYRHDDAVGSNAAAASKSANGNWIAYQSNANPHGTNGDFNQEIFLYNSLTGLIQQITQTTQSVNADPFMRGDGRQILFTSNANLTGGNSAVRNEVFVYDILAQSFSQLTTSTTANGSRGTAISDDGDRIALISDSDFAGDNSEGTPQAFVLDRGQQNFTQISQTTNQPVFESTYELVMSADGNRLAYTRGAAAPANLFIWNDGDLEGMLVRSGLHEGLSLSPSGRLLAFISHDNISGLNPQGNAEAFVYEPDQIALGDPGFSAGTATESAEVFSVTVNDAGLLALVTDADYVGGNNDGGRELVLHQLGSTTFEQLTQFTDNQAVQSQISAVNLGRNSSQCSYVFNLDLTPRIYMTGVRPSFFTALPTWVVDNIRVLQLLPLLCEENPKAR
ncbi:TolB family protein [Acanthopleuribacter pedis]|uniref:Uncharacterized protein n=1 Tax=Acanthopleuribacter pedis TaxID=442870 RepID=A0A8J7U4P7_9BACT|nr:hypothetical protein [Acanthopleuribacter pedis]MBO1319663.1 hypothetical protein [Acanthopleuribacter pedis]